MYFDNGLFSLQLPYGWSAEEADDGNVYVRSDANQEVWVSVEPNGVQFQDKSLSAGAFVERAYEDKLSLPSFVSTQCADGRYIARWQQSQQHEGKPYLLFHGLAAWKESEANLQLLMFQAAYPSALEGTTVAAEAQAFAWSAPAEVSFYAWRSAA